MCARARDARGLADIDSPAMTPTHAPSSGPRRPPTEGNTSMKRAILAFTLATIAILGSGTAALAAPAASQTISFTGYANFNSILGGNLNGPATVSGDINDGNLGDLRADVNFPLRDMSLTISPVDVLPLTTHELTDQWNRVTWDPCYAGPSTYG